MRGWDIGDRHRVVGFVVDRYAASDFKRLARDRTSQFQQARDLTSNVRGTVA